MFFLNKHYTVTVTITCLTFYRLGFAVSNGDQDEVMTLLISAEMTDFIKHCGFHQAVTQLNLEMVKVFLDFNVNVDSPDPTYRESPLMHAVRFNSKEMFGT